MREQLEDPPVTSTSTVCGRCGFLFNYTDYCQTKGQHCTRVKGIINNDITRMCGLVEWDKNSEVHIKQNFTYHYTPTAHTQDHLNNQCILPVSTASILNLTCFTLRIQMKLMLHPEKSHQCCSQSKLCAIYISAAHFMIPLGGGLTLHCAEHTSIDGTKTFLQIQQFNNSGST